MYIYIYIYIYVYIWADHGAAHPAQDHCLGACERRQVTTLEATQGQMDGFFSQLPYKCHLEEGGICGRLTSDLPSTRLVVPRKTTAWAPASGARYRGDTKNYLDTVSAV